MTVSYTMVIKIRKFNTYIRVFYDLQSEQLLSIVPIMSPVVTTSLGLYNLRSLHYLVFIWTAFVNVSWPSCLKKKKISLIVKRLFFRICLIFPDYAFLSGLALKWYLSFSVQLTRKHMVLVGPNTVCVMFDDLVKNGVRYHVSPSETYYFLL